MKLVSWNVNGIRAAYNKGFEDFFKQIDADIFAIQETKMQEGQLDLSQEGYEVYLNSAEKKGYSGTCIWTKIKPLNVTYDMGIEEHDKEGRIICLEFEKFFFITVYTPNSKTKLERLDYRQVWEDDFRKYVNEKRKTKPVVICGDLNVAHEDIDVKNNKANEGSAGFTKEERAKLNLLLESGFIDTFRYLHKDEEKFSWWSYFGKAREKNVGWRIDYFLVSDELEKNIKDAEIFDQILGSDHCPVYLELEV